MSLAPCLACSSRSWNLGLDNCDDTVSLVAQMVKNLPAVQEIQAQSLGQEDALEKGMAIHFGVLAWRIPMDRGAWQAIVRGVAKSQT